jgi:tetratricopeptide (TPR) repeat protein
MEFSSCFYNSLLFGILALEGAHPAAKNQEIMVFISYAREDSGAAKRLRKDLKDAGLNPWLDKEELLPGQNWENQIEDAISKSRYYIPLFSKTSVEKIGYVQSEFKFALDVLKRYPPNKIFYIPVRLDDCEIPYMELKSIHRADLFPVNDNNVWKEGVNQILRAIGVVIPKSEPVRPKLSLPFRGEKKIFVDREEYIHNKIKQYLKPSSTVSIIGPGGSGKSQLAFKAIHEYEKEGIFDLVIPIYLDRMITFDQFLIKMADKLGISQTDFQKYDVDERKGIITNALSDRNKPLILVDNFETILYAIPTSVTDYDKEYNGSTDIASFSSEDNAIQIKYYLNNNIPDNTSILVTSRERINLDREKRIDLEGLRQDDSNNLFAELAVDEQLKELSARQQTRQKISDMLTKTGGHPLSIEILAKNMRSIEEVEEVSDILGSKVNRDQPVKRLRSLQETFKFTLNKLDDNLKELLSKLTLFNSPFPISAAVEIFGAKEEDILSLYDHTMLTRIELADVYGQIEIPEYWLYKLQPAVRNYLASRMEENLEKEYGEAFSRFYLKFLSDTYNEWGKEKHLPSIVRFNIIAESENSDFDRAIELTKKNRNVAARISSLLGLIFSKLGILSKSLGYHRRSLVIDEELDERVEMAGDYGNIGAVLDDMGKYQQASDSYNKSLKIYEELNDRVGMASYYANIGVVLFNMGKYQQASDSYNKSLKIYEELNDRVGMAVNYANIGNVLSTMSKYQEALESLNKSLKIYEELNDRVGMAVNYANIGNVLSTMSNQEALESHAKALKIHEELNDRMWLAKEYKNIGVVLDNMGKHQEALDNHTKALKIDKDLNRRVGMALGYRNIGVVLNHMGKYPKALESHNMALKIHEELHDRVEMTRDYYNISFVLSKTSKEEALKSLYNALTILQEFERENNYRHPLMDKVNNRISDLKE